MLQIDRGPGRLSLVSRLARPRALAILALALGLAAAAGRSLPWVAGPLAALALLVVLLGGRAVRARFERGRVWVGPPVPFRRADDRFLAEFAEVRIETVAEARRRKAERLAREYLERSGGELPSWMRAPDAPGRNDHLRRLVLVPRGGEPLAVTAWLADDDLEPVRLEVEALLRT